MVQVVETLAYQVPCILSHLFHQRLRFQGSNQGKAWGHVLVTQLATLHSRALTCNACGEPCLAVTAVLPACGFTQLLDCLVAGSDPQCGGWHAARAAGSAGRPRCSSRRARSSQGYYTLCPMGRQRQQVRIPPSRPGIPRSQPRQPLPASGLPHSRRRRSSPGPQPGAAQQQGRPREDSSAGGRFDPPFPPPKRAAPPQQPAAAQPPQQQPQSAPQPGGQQQPQQQQAQQRRSHRPAAAAAAAAGSSGRPCGGAGGAAHGPHRRRAAGAGRPDPAGASISGSDFELCCHWCSAAHL